MFSPYLSWVFLFQVAPTAVLWLFFWRHLFKYWKIFVFVVTCSVVVGIVWDQYAYSVGIWFWPKDCCTLIRLPGGVPTEEIFWAIAASTYISTITIISRDIFKTHKKLKR